MGPFGPNLSHHRTCRSAYGVYVRFCKRRYKKRAGSKNLPVTFTIIFKPYRVFIFSLQALIPPEKHSRTSASSRRIKRYAPNSTTACRYINIRSGCALPCRHYGGRCDALPDRHAPCTTRKCTGSRGVPYTIEGRCPRLRTGVTPRRRVCRKIDDTAEDDGICEDLFSASCNIDIIPGVGGRRIIVRAGGNIFQIIDCVSRGAVVILHGIEFFLGVGGGGVTLVACPPVDPEIPRSVHGCSGHRVNRPDHAAGGIIKDRLLP